MFRISSKKALGQELKCKIILLVPGEELEISYAINSTGQDIMNSVVAELDLSDKDYYGLKIHDQIQWLDLSKLVSKQTKGFDLPLLFDLRFKYYPAEPALLANESTRYYLYLQLRLDLLEGRLRSESQDSLAYLIACVLQSELGNSDRKKKGVVEDNYVSEFKFVPNQTEDLERAAIRLHQNEDFQDLQPVDSELNFLKKACQLDTYGIDPFPVKEGNSHNHFLIGVNYLGISTFQDSRKTNQFSWSETERITLDNKLVLIYCRKLNKKGEKTSKSRPLFGFRCPSQEYAQNFWKLATEHRYFFTLESTPDEPIITNTGGLFKKNHKLKYIGRVEKDLLRDSVDEVRSTGVKRSHSLMSKTNDGPRWQGFQGGNNLQNSMNNIYASEFINKTMPSSMNYFREEEEEDNLLDSTNSDQQQQQTTVQREGGLSIFSKDSKKRPSIASASRDSPKISTFARRSTLTAKGDESLTENVIRRGSQIFMETDQQTHDFIKTSIFLLLLFMVCLLTILLINDSDRPNSISLLVKKMNLEHVSLALRENYYLPLKSALRDNFGRLFSLLQH